ncbi:hypothetical protein EDD16DRAFT_1729289 [Pisolithus croceorrhizus]|nr:hypothetical protein EDD16DRAFT_1729289 [Pisolithus croceorrhizus]KAI6111694.1 hypothetical protein EV401DRAFT_257654 [Pisolithus croceorrhizus]KAI6158377.1 hypothetical protein EDD17DRAFT_1016038 [Pisolithus thermaeus]
MMTKVDMRRNEVPLVVPTGELQSPPTTETKSVSTNVEGLQHHISRANKQRLASMTPEEIEKEWNGVLEQLGNNASDLLRRVREVRERKLAREDPQATGAEEKAASPEQTERPPIHHLDLYCLLGHTTGRPKWD